MDDFEMLLDESLQDPEFKKEWEDNQTEYEIMRMLVMARAEKNLTQINILSFNAITLNRWCIVLRNAALFVFLSLCIEFSIKNSKTGCLCLKFCVFRKFLADLIGNFP